MDTAKRPCRQHYGQSDRPRLPLAKLLEIGVHATVEDIVVAENINASYVSRVLRLTLLAPDLVEAILDGRQEREITLAALMKPFPVAWEDQTTAFL